MGSVSDKPGEGFTKVFLLWENVTKANEMLSSFCWMLQRNVPDVDYKQASQAKHFLCSMVTKKGLALCFQSNLNFADLYMRNV